MAEMQCDETDFKDFVFPTTVRSYSGLTRRDLFAAMMMQGILAGLPENAEHDSVLTCRLAVKFADALIEELNKPANLNH